MDFRAARAAFFDRETVIRAVDRATRTVYSKFGAFVRTRAKTSIKPAPKAGAGRRRRGRKSRRPSVSRPGGPPYSRTGLLKKFIFFAYDKDRKSVVIGPTLINRPTGAPENLEYGATIDAPDWWTSERGRRSKRIRIAARPYMRPAFDAELPKLPDLWRDAVR